MDLSAIGQRLNSGFRKLWFNLKYLSRPVWDTGITPPELVELVEGGQLPPGRAIDLGCGTGTNVIYLAQHGFEAVGVDAAWLSILQARRKARAAGVRAVFRVGDVTDLSFLRHPLDFALDMGCFQGLVPADQARYAASLASHTRPGALFLMYAWGAGRQVRLLGEMGVSPETVAQTFALHFEVCWVRHGEERGQPSAWYLLKRR